MNFEAPLRHIRGGLAAIARIIWILSLMMAADIVIISPPGRDMLRAWMPWLMEPTRARLFVGHEFLMRWFLCMLGGCMVYAFHAWTILHMQLWSLKRRAETRLGLAPQPGFFEPNWVSEWRFHRLRVSKQLGFEVIELPPQGPAGLWTSRLAFLLSLFAPCLVMAASALAMLPLNLPGALVNCFLLAWMASEVTGLMKLVCFGNKNHS